jgi:hypothetical protein
MAGPSNKIQTYMKSTQGLVVLTHPLGTHVTQVDGVWDAD